MKKPKECKHKWEVHDSYSQVIGWVSSSASTYVIFVCKKCGNAKKVLAEESDE